MDYPIQCGRWPLQRIYYIPFERKRVTIMHAAERARGKAVEKTKKKPGHSRKIERMGQSCWCRNLVLSLRKAKAA